MRRDYRPQKQRQKEVPIVIRPTGPRRMTPLSLVEWENPQTLAPDVRQSRIREAFRPRGYDYEITQGMKGEDEGMSSANSRS